MATYFGSNGAVKLATSGDAVAALGEVLNWSLTMTADTVDSTSMGDSARTYVKGLSQGTASLSCFWDDDDTAQIDLVQGDTVDCEFYANQDSGDDYYKGDFIVTSVGRGTSHDGLATLDVELQLNGDLTISQVS
jgi:predicted secreted protein